MHDIVAFTDTINIISDKEVKEEDRFLLKVAVVDDNLRNNDSIEAFAEHLTDQI